MRGSFAVLPLQNYSHVFADKLLGIDVGRFFSVLPLQNYSHVFGGKLVGTTAVVWGIFAVLPLQNYSHVFADKLLGIDLGRCFPVVRGFSGEYLIAGGFEFLPCLGCFFVFVFFCFVFSCSTPLPFPSLSSLSLHVAGDAQRRGWRGRGTDRRPRQVPRGGETT